MIFIVAEKQHGIALLAFLKEQYKGKISVKQLKRAVDSRFCKVNGKVEYFSSHPLRSGDRVELDLSTFLAKTQPASIDVLWEDPDFAIVDKPPGIECADAAFQAILHEKWRLAHRLDKETSGLVLLTKTDRAHLAAKELFMHHKIQKSYLALVQGEMKSKKGVIDNFLGKKGGYQGQTIYGSIGQGKGQRAITHWSRLGKGKKVSLLRCELITGRTHQIRVHLSELGFPILGDYQYGPKAFCYHAMRQLLHAWKLSFQHPFTRKQIQVQAKVPSDFLQAMQHLTVTLDGASDLASCKE